MNQRNNITHMFDLQENDIEKEITGLSRHSSPEIFQNRSFRILDFFGIETENEKDTNFLKKTKKKENMNIFREVIL